MATSTTWNLIHSFLFGPETSISGTLPKVSEDKSAQQKTTMDSSLLFEELLTTQDENKESKMADMLLVSDYCTVQPNKESITLHITTHFDDAVHDYLKDNLNFWKADFKNNQNGYIYKEQKTKGVTVTIWETTKTLLVQGSAYREWSENFCKLHLPNPNTEMKMLFSPEPKKLRASTPIPSHNSVDERCEKHDTMTESDVVLANHCENSNVDCENSNVDMDALRREISTLQKLLKQLHGKCENNVDTRSIGTQTDEIISNTQTADLEFAPLNLTV